ncbi:hypothetical protein [Neorhodopirellula lusitana]|uniref:hypothetical protein n=1 Tax=Neorhodopirellula lusitana TaxID=445327 RepID=UPI00384BBC3B
MSKRPFFIVCLLACLAFAIATSVEVASQSPRPEKPPATDANPAHAAPSSDNRDDRSAKEAREDDRPRDGKDRRDRDGRDGGGKRGPGGKSSGSEIMFGLLRSGKVQAELKMAPEQLERIRNLERQLRDQQREQFNLERGDGSPKEFDFRNASEEERAKLFQKIQNRREEQRNQLVEILQAEQVKRLEQIAIQVHGSMALGSPKVQQELALTHAQLEKLKQIRRIQDEKMRKSYHEMRQAGPRQDSHNKIQAIRTEIESMMLDVLDPDQRKQFESLKGEPFDVSSLLRGSRGEPRSRRGRGDDSRG